MVKKLQPYLKNWLRYRGLLLYCFSEWGFCALQLQFLFGSLFSPQFFAPSFFLSIEMIKCMLIVGRKTKRKERNCTKPSMRQWQKKTNNNSNQPLISPLQKQWRIPHFAEMSPRRRKTTFDCWFACCGVLWLALLRLSPSWWCTQWATRKKRNRQNASHVPVFAKMAFDVNKKYQTTFSCVL